MSLTEFARVIKENYAEPNQINNKRKKERKTKSLYHLIAIALNKTATNVAFQILTFQMCAFTMYIVVCLKRTLTFISCQK